jgi:hypothetical protein
MTKFGMLIIVCTLEAMLPTFASAKAPHGKIGSPYDARRTSSPAVNGKNPLFLRQDLFDRQNPTNLRSDWPSPPAQPGQL